MVLVNPNDISANLLQSRHNPLIFTKEERLLMIVFAKGEEHVLMDFDHIFANNFVQKHI